MTYIFTFLAFMENRRAGVVFALLRLVTEGLATTLVDTFLRRGHDYICPFFCSLLIFIRSSG